ncbi:MAG: L-threonate dehydrogenase, partial [Burkholderiaceae bacterium]
GMGVARNLRKHNFELYACDLNKAALKTAAGLGASTSTSPAQIAPHVDILLILVVNADQTEAVLFGEHGAVNHLAPGAIVITSSTMPPLYTEALDKRLQERGLRLIDAPVSGGAVGANAGNMTIMAAGEPATIKAAKPVFDAISGRVYQLGDTPGMGSKVKMINQLLAGVHIASATEAMALGIRAGIDPQALFEVISNSAGSSWMFQNRVPHILDGDYTPLSAVDIFVKDLGIVLDSARQMKFPLPLTASAHQMFLATSAAGMGGEDDSAVIKMFERLTGIELPNGSGQSARGQSARKNKSTKKSGKKVTKKPVTANKPATAKKARGK